MTSNDLIKVEQLSHHYGDVQTFNQVSFTVKQGQVVCLLGPSGSGKSTLLRSIAGFEQPSSGRILMNDQVISSNDKILPPEKRKMGFVFQDFALFPHLDVKQNVMFGLNHLPKALALKKCKDLLERVEMLEFADVKPEQLSGGQQQRVSLARALAPEPSLILFDEPFSSLDPTIVSRLKFEMKALLRKLNITALIVTHNQEDAFDLGDEIGRAHSCSGERLRIFITTHADVKWPISSGAVCFLKCNPLLII